VLPAALRARDAGGRAAAGLGGGDDALQDALQDELGANAAPATLLARLAAPPAL
jgi:hypothetical protein